MPAESRGQSLSLLGPLWDRLHPSCARAWVPSSPVLETTLRAPFHCLRRSPATAAIGIFQCLLCRAGRSSFPLGVLSHGRSFTHEANKWLFQESPLASCFRRSSLPNATGLSHGTNSQAGMGRGSLQSLQKLCAAFVAGISCQSLTAT